MRLLQGMDRRKIFTALLLLFLLELKAFAASPVQERADRFLALANAGYQAVYRVNSEAQWNAMTDVTPEHDAAAEATGKAYAEKLKNTDVLVYCVLSDGEFQEGSTWEAMMMAANLKLDNLIAFMDFNDFGGLEHMSDGHPAFYPLVEKAESFGWESVEVDGHDEEAMREAVTSRRGGRPMLVVCRTVKGKGVSYMENVAIWHYRSPNKDEYQQGLKELAESPL